MGNVQVKYKARRGSAEAGAEITDPKDFLTECFTDEEWPKLKAAYDGAGADI